MTTEQVLGQFFSDDAAWGKPIEHRADFWGPGLKHAIIIGSRSDIAQAIKARLEGMGWTVHAAGRDDLVPDLRWDLMVLALGTMEPIGKFFTVSRTEFHEAVVTNALLPLGLVRDVWPHRKQGAKVVFFGGPNLSKPTPTYTAYRAGKALLASLVDTLNVEYPENKFILFNPGVVNTKIHKQTIRAGEQAANYERVMAIVSGEEPSVPMETVVQKFLDAIK